MNYTKPNNEDYEDNPGNWLFATLLFAKTLGFLIPTGKGIVVDLVGDMIDLYPNAKRVIVYANEENQIAVENADERTDLKEGDCVTMLNKKDLIN